MFNSQLNAINCKYLAGTVKAAFVIVDTSISCISNSYGQFRMIDAILIVFYQGIVAGYLVLLYTFRHKLNPMKHVDFDSNKALALRDSDDSIVFLKFLFKDIRCER